MEHAEPHPVPDTCKTADETAPQPVSKIPWENRKQIGRIRAYWRTAWMVMANPSELQQFLDAPVCEKHAKSFRRVTMQLTAIVTFGVLIVLLSKSIRFAFWSAYSLRAFESIVLGVLARMILAVLALIGLFLATRSLEWFSNPKDFDPVRQDRAIALSCYVCGPILIVTVTGGIASLAIIFTRTVQDMQTIMRVISLAWVAVFLAWWPAAVRANYFTTGRSGRRTAIAAVALPLIWTGQQMLVGVIPISVVQWVIMVSTVS
ncbi:MAG: hypothetical protein QGG42_00310 [Phycisphaerae bacterium]|jgi:hypothetical protein|nr:hypothetical protein [Phycisphaerae bacterium]